jgi:branched-subunit amino acid aminotransferase/4-amino-4-deoxychorismate lyase
LYKYFSDNFEIKSQSSYPNLLEDTGFLYGYGLFETILIQKKISIFFKEHFNRLEKSAKVLGIPFDILESKMLQAINALIEINNINDAKLNIYLTAGCNSSKKNIRPHSRFLLVVRSLPIEKEYSLTIKKDKFSRTTLDSLKTLSFLRNFLEKKQAYPFDDVILYNSRKNILETTTANVFFIKERTIFTPKSSLILSGIARNWLKNNCPKIGLSFKEVKINLTTIQDYEEIFLTNSLRGIILVKSVEDFPNLCSKNITQQIRDYYSKSIEK